MAPRRSPAEAAAPENEAAAAHSPEAASPPEAEAVLAAAAAGASEAAAPHEAEAAAAAAAGGAVEAPPACAAAGEAAAEASAEASPEETGAAGGRAADEVGSAAPQGLQRQPHDASPEPGGSAAEANTAPIQYYDMAADDSELEQATPPEQAQAPPGDGRKEEEGEEEEEFWFLPDDWEMYWDEGNDCPVFYDSWTGNKKYTIAETSAVKAKGRSQCPELPEAVRIRLVRGDCVGVVNQVQGSAVSPAPEPAQGAAGGRAPEAPAETPPDAVQAAPPDEVPQAKASDFPKEGTGTTYTVKVTTVVVPYKRTLTDERQMKLVGDSVELFGWDESRQWRQCYTELRGYGYVGRTAAACLQMSRKGGGTTGRPLPPLPLEPLALAAVEDDVELLRELLAARCSPNLCSDRNCGTPLRYALEHGSANSCVFLFHAGARDVKAVEGAAAPMKALLLALDGVDDEQLDIKLMDKQVAELRPEAQELVDSMLNDIAERKARERAQAEEARFREEHNSLLRKLEQEEKEDPFLAEARKQRTFRDEYSNFVLQLEREDEEERIHRRLEQDGLRRLRMRRMREMEAQMEAEERRLRQEAEEAEAERRKVEAERKRWVEEETSEVIKRLQQAQLRFEKIQKSQEEKEAQEEERKQERFRQRLQEARQAREQEEQEERRLREERERRMLEKELKARERQRQRKEEEAKEKLRLEQLEQLESLFCEQKAAAWTCMECGNDSVFHPDCPGCCMFCGTPQHQGHIAKTWEGWSVGAGGAAMQLE